MPTTLTPEQLAELRAMDSPTVANAIEAFKVRDDTQGFLGMDVPCHTPGVRGDAGLRRHRHRQQHGTRARPRPKGSLPSL